MKDGWYQVEEKMEKWKSERTRVGKPETLRNQGGAPSVTGNAVVGRKAGSSLRGLWGGGRGWLGCPLRGRKPQRGPIKRSATTQAKPKRADCSSKRRARS